mgnify:CR=1 FL=1
MFESNQLSTAKATTHCVTVIGGGLIGVSWAALMLARGHHVCVFDIAPDFESGVRQGIADMMPSLREMGLSTDGMATRLSFQSDLAAALHNVGVVMECGPDRLRFKQRLWAEVEKLASPDALLLSSSSGIKASWQAKGMRHPGRVIVGHPFNPPHIIPLVEVAPGRKTDPELVERAMAFYRSLGKKPVLLRKEVPGFVANRLQAAMFRECVSLVRSGVVSTEELDDIVTHSIGLRWAVDGPFKSFHLGGGAEGFAGYLKHFARSLQLAWLQMSMTPVFLTARLRRKLIQQTDLQLSGKPPGMHVCERNAKQIAVMRTLSQETLPGEQKMITGERGESDVHHN